MNRWLLFPFKGPFDKAQNGKSGGETGKLFDAAFATREKNRGLALPQFGGQELCDCAFASSCRAVVAKLSTKFATLSIGEIRFNWFNAGKKPVPDE